MTEKKDQPGKKRLRIDKLELNPETVQNLTEDEAGSVKGGLRANTSRSCEATDPGSCCVSGGLGCS
jgi:hypothetical protein